jgi:hypothetical protein
MRNLQLKNVLQYIPRNVHVTQLKHSFHVFLPTLYESSVRASSELR